jgi:hypothetical protein
MTILYRPAADRRVPAAAELTLLAGAAQSVSGEVDDAGGRIGGDLVSPS